MSGNGSGRRCEKLQYCPLGNDLQAALQALIAQGRKDGMIRASDLASHLEKMELSPDKIEVVIHRESVLHSAVEYIDNSIIGEFSVPDMRMCIQYAIDYPERCEGRGEALSLTSLGRMTFAKPDEGAFPLLQMARRAFFEGGACPAVLNAADEIAVDAFLKEKIRFSDIPTVIMNTYDMMRGARYAHSVRDILSADEEARKIALQYTK